MNTNITAIRFLAAGVGLLSSFLLIAPSSAHAFLGDCSQPVTTGPNPVATDCLRILQAGVGSEVCVPECICEPKGSAPPTATDALICLQKAVGQPVVLACPCSVSTTTSTMFPFFDTELLVLTKNAANYVTSDLAGTWDSQLIVSGPGAPAWSRGALAIQANGAASGNLTNIDGSVDPIAVTLSLSSTGMITCLGIDCPAAFQGGVDAGKTVAAITFTDDDTSSVLMVLTKRGGAYTQTDLSGNWEFNGLASGPGAPWFGRGTLAIQSNGAFSGSITDSDGTVEIDSGTLGLSGTGVLSCSGIGCLANFAGGLDAGKTIGVSTSTDIDNSSEMDIIAKKAGAYSQADLTGNWQLNSVVSGFQAPLWERGPLTIQSNGTVSSGTLTDSTGFVEDISGFILNLAGDGIITAPGDPLFRCALDAGKTVAVCTADF